MQTEIKTTRYFNEEHGVWVTVYPYMHNDEATSDAKICHPRGPEIVEERVMGNGVTREVYAGGNHRAYAANR